MTFTFYLVAGIPQADWVAITSLALLSIPSILSDTLFLDILLSPPATVFSSYLPTTLVESLMGFSKNSNPLFHLMLIPMDTTRISNVILTAVR